MSFNQLSVHTLLLLLFISITVTHWGNQQEQDQTVLGWGWGLKWSHLVHGRPCWWSQSAAGSHGSAPALLSVPEPGVTVTHQPGFATLMWREKKAFGCWSLLFLLFYNSLPGATGSQSCTSYTLNYSHTWASLLSSVQLIVWISTWISAYHPCIYPVDVPC